MWFWCKVVLAVGMGGFALLALLGFLSSGAPKDEQERKDRWKVLSLVLVMLLASGWIGLGLVLEEAKAPDAAKPQTEVVATQAPAPTKAPSYKDIEALVNVRPEVQAMQDSKGRYKVVVWVYNGSDKEIVRGTARLELIGSDGKVINDGWTDELHMLPLDGTKPRQRRYGVYWVEGAIDTMTYRVEVEVLEVRDAK